MSTWAVFLSKWNRKKTESEQRSCLTDWQTASIVVSKRVNYTGWKRMNRKVAREIALKLIYELEFHSEAEDEALEWRVSREAFSLISDEDDAFESYPNDIQLDYILRVVRGVRSHLTELDGHIDRYLISWKRERVSCIAVSVLRLCVFELIYLRDEIPPGSSINEAVELTKKYDSDETASFVNGVLGAFFRAEEI
jgi:N utilization substance protein B